MNLSYIAGFVDGEGCIQFTKCRTSIYPRVLVVNTNKMILEKLRDKFGGDIKPLSLRKENWKQGWMWRLSWSKAVDFIRKIYPQIILKREQCKLIFEWDRIRLGSGEVNSERKRKYMQTIDLLRLKMKSLNKKGSK